MFLISCSIKIVTRTYEGSTILVYCGFTNSLIIDNIGNQVNSSNRFLYGQLPSGKQVWAKINIWDGTIKIGIGSEHDEKQII